MIKFSISCISGCNKLIKNRHPLAMIFRKSLSKVAVHFEPCKFYYPRQIPRLAGFESSGFTTTFPPCSDRGRSCDLPRVSSRSRAVVNWYPPDENAEANALIAVTSAENKTISPGDAETREGASTFLSRRVSAYNVAVKRHGPR